LTRPELCVKMSNMKTATVRDVQHNLAEILTWVEHGQEVLVLRRKRVVARLLPPEPRLVESPDFTTRARGIWGARPRGKRLSELAAEARGNR
jgi:antitoxin (DNA-binding transcriptional repressor) of toxin-antitoxin stability system